MALSRYRGSWSKRIIDRCMICGLAVVALPLPALAQTRRITDVMGRKVALTAAPRRVIVMFNYEELMAIAAPEGWQRVVGTNRQVWEGWRPLILSHWRAVIPCLAALSDVGSTVVSIACV